MEGIFEAENQDVFYAKVFDRLQKLKDKTINFNEIKELVQLLMVFDERFLPEGEVEIPEVSFFVGADNHLASYDRLKGLMLSTRYVQKVISGEVPFIYLLRSVGHEMRHMFQHEVIENFETYSGSPRYKTVYSAAKHLYDKHLSVEELNTMFAVCKNFLSKEFAERVEKMSEAERFRMFQDMSIGQYANLKYEQDARNTGELFAVSVMGDLYKHKLCDSYMRDWLAKQANEIKNWKLESQSWDRDYSCFEPFEKEIKTLTMDNLASLENSIYSMQVAFEDSEKGRQLSREAMNALQGAVQLILQDKTIDEKEELFLACMKTSGFGVRDLVFRDLKKDPDFTKQEAQRLGFKIADMFANDDVDRGVYSIIRNDLLDDEQRIYLAQNALKNRKMELVEELLSEQYYENSASSANFFKKIAPDILQACKDFIKNPSEFYLRDYFGFGEMINRFVLHKERNFEKQCWEPSKEFNAKKILGHGMVRQLESVYEELQHMEKKVEELMDADELYQRRIGQKIYGKKSFEKREKRETKAEEDAKAIMARKNK